MYAGLLGLQESETLAAICPGLPESTAQCWMASPYHAQLSRDSVVVLSDALLPLTNQDAEWLCEQLNPLLFDEGMTLVARGAALLLCCREPLQASPVGFGNISGKRLPDRLAQGVDDGRLMRLQSEIQMHLHRYTADHRRAKCEPDIHGLWFWAAGVPSQADLIDSPRVATRNPCLQSMVNGQDATAIISEAERLSELFRETALLPKHVLLTGDGHALLLSKSILPRFGAVKLKPKSVKSEAELFSLLWGMLHVA